MLTDSLALVSTPPFSQDEPAVCVLSTPTSSQNVHSFYAAVFIRRACCLRPLNTNALAVRSFFLRRCPHETSLSSASSQHRRSRKANLLSRWVESRTPKQNRFPRHTYRSISFDFVHSILRIQQPLFVYSLFIRWFRALDEDSHANLQDFCVRDPCNKLKLLERLANCRSTSSLIKPPRPPKFPMTRQEQHKVTQVHMYIFIYT